MTRMMDILADYLDVVGVKHLRLDGSTKVCLHFCLHSCQTLTSHPQTRMSNLILVLIMVCWIVFV